MDVATRILIVEDLPSDALLAEREIKKVLTECAFLCVETRSGFIAALEEFKPDVVVTDYRMPQFDGLTALRIAQERTPLTPVIVLTSAINEDTAVECMKSGAADYVIKEHIKRLGQAVIRTLNEKQTRVARVQAERQLEAWHDRYELVAATGKMLFYDSSTNDDTIHWSESIKEVLGFTLAEMSGGFAQWLELVHPEDREKTLRQFKLAEHNMTTFDTEYRFRTQPGRYIILHDRGFPVRDSEAGTIRFVGVMEDITRRKEMESTLHLTQFCVDRASVGIIRTGPDSRVLGANDIACRNLGYSLEELCLLSIPDIDPSFNSNRWEAHREELKIRGSLTYESVHRRKNATPLPVEVTSNYIEFEGEGFAFSFVHDITDRRKAEEALRQSEEGYKTLAHTLPDAMTVVDTVGNITYASPAALTLYGDYTEEEVLGKNILTWVHPSNHERALRNIQSVLQGGTVTDKEYRLLKRDGSFFFGEVSAARMQDQSGNATGVIVIVRDASERKRSEQEIKHTISLLQATLESTADGILVVNRKGVVVGFNRRFQQMWQIPDAVVNSKNDARLLEYIVNQLKEPEQFLSRVRELYSQPLAESHDAIAFKDGKTFERYSLPQRIGDAPVGRVWSFRDVTRARHAEEALRESEKRYQTLTEASPVGIFRTDANGHTTYVNPRWRQLSGLSAAEAAEDGWLHAVHPADRDKIGHGWGASTQAHNDSIAEYRFMRADGSVVWVMGQTVPEVDTMNQIVGYVGTITDITDRKKAEETRRLLSHTMEGISEIATITDLEHRLTFVNNAFLHTYGYERDEVLGRQIGFLWSPNNPPGLLQEILNHSQTGSWKGEILNLTKDGREFPVSLHTSQVKDENDQTIGLVGISEDITARKQLEAQLQQAQKMEAIGRLAGGVAHDFNNMIGVILGYAKLIESKLNQLDPLHKNVKAIVHAAERSANLTKQLLTFARKQVVAPVPLNLNDALSSLHRMLMRLVGEDITLALHPSKEIWTIKIDPTQVDQILANLATNARDAIDDVGIITIETANVMIDQSYLNWRADFIPGNYVMLAFGDTGKGMDRATQERIFEPFFTTKPEGKGTGLGLATVFGIVKQNGGFIEVHSEPSKGTTFKIYFPRYHGDAEKPVEKPEEVPLRGTETILIVEDEEQLLELSCAALEMYGYTVLPAKSPGEAIILCERTDKKIDLIITDVVMPGMNGKELSERLHTLKPGMKTIFMSGYTADVVALRGILEEGVSFLQKPFTPLMLAKKVRDELNR